MVSKIARPDAVLIDTNVLIYASVPGHANHQVARQRLEALRLQGAETWISRQVLREFAVTMTRPQVVQPVLGFTQVQPYLLRFEAHYRVAEDGPGIAGFWRMLAALQPDAGRQLHDTNIVATMLRYGIHQILTNNQADFQRYEPDYISILPL